MSMEILYFNRRRRLLTPSVANYFVKQAYQATAAMTSLIYGRVILIFIVY